MIRLPDRDLPSQAQVDLERWQQAIDAIADYAERVAEAKAKFSQRNRKDNATFAAVREALAEMCSGARMCGYCETSSADEVEHIRPKDLYPEMVFVWANYLYACGPCHGPKNNRFAVFDAATGEVVDVTRAHRATVEPPLAGEPVLLNPREDDPLEYLDLDLGTPDTKGSFVFLPAHDEGTTEHRRAQYTLEILRLNHRDELLAARDEAYRNYRARLIEYIACRDRGAPQAELDDLITALKRMGHPTVWQEMKRQRALLPELADLFDRAPEALAW